jgi:hypothetical protein
MIKKEELLNVLKEAANMEDRSVPLYTTHLKSAIFWVGLSDDKVHKVKDAFSQLASESVRHKSVIEALIKRIEEAGKDAF